MFNLFAVKKKKKKKKRIYMYTFDPLPYFAQHRKEQKHN